MIHSNGDNSIIISHSKYWNSTAFSNKLTQSYNYPDNVGSPRISSSNDGVEKYEAVFAHSTQNATFIIGFNYDYITNIVAGPTVLNSSLTIDNNNAPCVSYISSNRIAVSWTHETILSSNKNILLKKLDGIGNTISSNYYLVNKTVLGNQVIPSLSGRYAGGHDALYTYHVSTIDEIQYKVSSIYNSSVRLKNPANKPLFYPNPAKHSIYVNMTDNTYSNTLFEIFDSQGRKVLVQELVNIKTEVDINKLSEGVYFVRITTPIDILFKKLIVY
jgi:hypothetical protein